MAKKGEIWCFSILLTIWYKNFNSASIGTQTGLYGEQNQGSKKGFEHKIFLI